MLIEILPPFATGASRAARFLSDRTIERLPQGPEEGAVAAGNAADASRASSGDPTIRERLFAPPCCRVHSGVSLNPGLLRRGPGW